MPQPYSYQPDAGMLQQYYATVMPQATVQPAMVNPEQVNQYSQQSIPVAVPVPEVQNYAPQQQFVQQAPQQQMLQPDPQLIAYNKLIEDRFNELANKFGGVQYLAETGNLERAQKKAARDIASYWGPPPKPQQPMSEKERVELEQAKLQERKARFDLQQAQKQAANPEKKPSELMSKVMTKASDYLVTIDPMLGQLEGALVQLENPNTDINTRLSNARTLGKLINSLQVGSPDAVGADEAKMLMSELDEKVFNTKGIFTSEQVYGTNLPQFVNKMKSIRDRVSGEYNKNLERLTKFDPVMSTYYQPREITSPTAQPTGKPAAGQPAAKQEVEEYYDPVTGWTTKPPAQ
jgi:hypothetical protein